jgi:CRP-like cAMP-binding protein
LFRAREAEGIIVLLMADDRAEERELPFTHEFLSSCLVYAGAGVTVALNGLEAQGLIRRRRGTIAILDREGLAKTTNGFYDGPEAEARRLFRRAAAE